MRSLPLVLLAACVGRDAAPPPLLLDAPPSPGRTAYFDAMAQADYTALDGVIATLQAEESAGDAVSGAVLGFAHAWRLSEWRRTGEDTTAHAELAAEAFDRAVDAFPSDPRLVGFRGSMLQAQGTIDERGALQRKGWFDTVESARRWPEWGQFTQGYGLVTFEPDHRRVQQGAELFWRTLDDCAGVELERGPFRWADHRPAVLASDEFDVRACDNTPVAPHNIEGFFLVFADFYIKSGDLDLAAVMLDNALESDDGTWPHRALAEDRLARLQELTPLYATEADADTADEDMTVFGSTVGCMVCHQAE
ncbi:MAG: hypothetical protein KTR31_39095 [Myxococcales bacterium]|nr:hypothetical protein [Myxococcales bacterium]